MSAPTSEEVLTRAAKLLQETDEQLVKRTLSPSDALSLINAWSTYAMALAAREQLALVEEQVLMVREVTRLQVQALTPKDGES